MTNGSSITQIKMPGIRELSSRTLAVDGLQLAIQVTGMFSKQVLVGSYSTILDSLDAMIG